MSALERLTFAAEEFDDGLGAGLDVELFVNRMEMGADGAESDAELVGDFFVEITFGEEREDFLFAFSEALDIGSGLADLLEMIDDFPGDLHGHGSAAGVNLFDGLDEIGRRHVLEEITARAVAE